MQEELEKLILVPRRAGWQLRDTNQENYTSLVELTSLEFS